MTSVYSQTSQFSADYRSTSTSTSGAKLNDTADTAGTQSKSNSQERDILDLSDAALTITPLTKVVKSPNSGTTIASLSREPNTANYAEMVKQSQVAMDNYIKMQQDAGKNIVQHNFLTTESLDKNTGKVDEYGYMLFGPESWVMGRGVAVQNPTHFMPAEYKQSMMNIPGQGLFYVNILESDLEQMTPFVPTDINGQPVYNKSDSELKIKSVDVCQLGGLTLNERKLFLDTVQTILDKSGIKDENGNSLNSRGLTYDYWTTPNANGKQTMVGIDFHQSVKIAESDRQEIVKLLSANQTLVSLVQEPANYAGNVPSLGGYSISLTDKNGVALPENQLIVKSGDSNKQVQMSIDEFSKLNREQIYSIFT
ncbi:MAG: hypothetical protein ACRC2T_07085 [Thermoguttaceae bacterium]